MRDLSELKARAKAATAGPWRTACAKEPTDGAYDWAIIAGERQIIAEVFGRVAETEYPPAEATAAYIAAFSPDVAEALIDEIERLRRALKPFAKAAKVVEQEVESREAVRDNTPVENVLFPSQQPTVGHLRAARSALGEG